MSYSYDFVFSEVILGRGGVGQHSKNPGGEGGAVWRGGNSMEYLYIVKKYMV